ncbi:hypothetical protein ACH5RR_032427 [Cinchona calisaya]|uniref:RNase H type-1 domain-containing protein n=1 Tax=Cinchona calisaya TaxID=153742 RepID=A0ABD2YLJ4_9GENT
MAFLFADTSPTTRSFLLAGLLNYLVAKKKPRIISVFRNPPNDNTYGIAKGNSRLVSRVSIIKDSYGFPITAFSNYYGDGTNMQAEAFALLDGLKLCKRFNIKIVQVELDS